jgi:hypothetical protein
MTLCKGTEKGVMKTGACRLICSQVDDARMPGQGMKEGRKTHYVTNQAVMTHLLVV